MKPSTQTREFTAERRMPNRLIRYWDELRGGKLYPMENDIDPDAVADLWPHCFLVQVRDIIHDDGNYTYLGEAIRKAFAAGLDGEGCRQIISPNYRDLGHNFTTILQEQRPIMQEGEFKNLRNKSVLFRQCMLPLGVNGTEGIAAILGCMAFKVEP